MKRPARQAILGAVYALFVFGCMHVKIPVAPGVQVDQRNAIIILAGFFGGPLAGFIAASVGIGYRAFLGGVGVLGGSFGMLLSATAGFLLGRFRKKIDSPWKMAVASVSAAVFVLPGFLPIGSLREGWNLMLRMAVPYGSAISIGVLFGSVLIMNEERRQSAALHLEKSEKRYRELFESFLDVSYRVAPDGCFLVASPSIRKVLGYEPEELIGKPVSDFYLDPGMRETLMARLDGSGRLENEELELVRKDGAMAVVSLNARKVFDGSGAFLWIEGVMRDVTQAKRAAEEKERLEKALRQGQKMQAIGQLAGGIAHDFNNMLSGIIGFTELAQSQLGPGHAASGSLQQVLSASERAKRLVERILTFSRGSTSEMRAMRLGEAVSEALNLLRMTVPSSVSLDISLGEESGTVMAEATQIHEAIMNIATNGVHAMGGKGVLGVALREESVAAPRIGRVGTIEPGRYTVVEIRDTGAGMDDAMVEKAFEPFFTTKPLGEGTGMGLSVVYGIMQGHGGDIIVESEPGKGTSMSLYFPQRGEAQPAESADQDEPVPGGDERVLFVDDEEMIVEFTTSNLRSLGYRVTALADPARALELLEADPYGHDILITDLAMPRMNGVELAKAALALNPGLPVILCTGYSSDLAEAEALAAGIRKVCMKPVRKRDMGITLRRILDEKG